MEKKMEDRKYVQKLLAMSGKYDLDRKRELNIHETHTSFEGIPKKHPTNKNVLILLTDSFNHVQKFYEFSIETIGNIEDLGTITNKEGKSVTKIRVWVKKGMPAICSESFIVR